MLHKHYFPNQQTPLLGRQIRSGVAILEKANQGARSAKVSEPAVFGVEFFNIFYALVFWWVFFWLVCLGYFLLLFCFLIFGVFWVFFFVAFDTGTASGLACKSCWALLDFTSARHAEQPGRAERGISTVASLPFQRSRLLAQKGGSSSRARRVS